MSCISVDSRVGTSDLFNGFKRCAIHAIENKVDLINYSVGESLSHFNGGPYAEVISELVDKAQIVFVAGAGNSGPALSTVVSPGELQRKSRKA